MIERRKIITFYSLLLSAILFSCQEDDTETKIEKEVVIQSLEKIVDFEPKQGVEGDTIRISLDATSVEDLKPYYVLMQYEDRQDTMTVVGEGGDYIDFRIPLDFSLVGAPITLGIKYAGQDSLRTKDFNFEFLPLKIHALPNKLFTFEDDTLAIFGDNYSKYQNAYELKVFLTELDGTIVESYSPKIGADENHLYYHLSYLENFYSYDIELYYNDILVYEASDFFTIMGNYQVYNSPTWVPYGTAQILLTPGHLKDIVLTIDGHDLHYSNYARKDGGRRYLYKLPNIAIDTHEIEISYNGLPIPSVKENTVEVVNETFHMPEKEINQGEELVVNLGHWTNGIWSRFVLKDLNGNVISDEVTSFTGSFFLRRMNEVPGQYLVEISHYWLREFPDEEPHILTPLDGNIITIK